MENVWMDEKCSHNGYILTGVLYEAQLETLVLYDPCKSRRGNVSQPPCLPSWLCVRVSVWLNVCVPTWQLRVIKKGCEGAIQRFLVINEEQHWQPQERTHTHKHHKHKIRHICTHPNTPIDCLSLALCSLLLSATNTFFLLLSGRIKCDDPINTHKYIHTQTNM